MSAQHQHLPPRGSSADSVGHSLLTLFGGFFGQDDPTTGHGGSSSSRSTMSRAIADTRGRSLTEPWSSGQTKEREYPLDAPRVSPQTMPRAQHYQVDKEDLLDQHVGYYLRHHPEVHARHSLVRKRPKVYELDGREIRVDWQYATEPGGQGFLVVIDGPLRQPFADYMAMSEENAEYETQTLGMNSASLHMIPKEQRVSFHDQHKVYSRLEAMKVAKEQAKFRETAADLVKDGREVPADLMTKYKKTIDQKLGRRQRHGDPQVPANSLPTVPLAPQGPHAPKASRDYAEGHAACSGSSGWPYSQAPAGPSAYPSWSRHGSLTPGMTPGLTPPNLFQQPSAWPASRPLSDQRQW